MTPAPSADEQLVRLAIRARGDLARLGAIVQGLLAVISLVLLAMGGQPLPFTLGAAGLGRSESGLQVAVFAAGASDYVCRGPSRSFCDVTPQVPVGRDRRPPVRSEVLARTAFLTGRTIGKASRGADHAL